MLYNKNTGKTEVQNPRAATGTTYGSGVVVNNRPIDTSNKYFGGAPAGPKKPAYTAPAAPAAPAAGTGVLRTPGEGEQWWNANKERLSQPSIMADKSYTEQLYESGNQGLNTFYDRERNKRQSRLEDTMSAAGVFGSGATAKGMFELEAELGASQAKDMADLGAAADFAKGRRDSQMLARDVGTFGMARGAQDIFQDRERMPLDDKMKLADRYGAIFRDIGGKSTDEQFAIGEQIIQSIIAEGGVDANGAAQQVEDLFRMYGIGLKAADLISRRSGGDGGDSQHGNSSMDPYTQG